jgi:hypothetical protein
MMKGSKLQKIDFEAVTNGEIASKLTLSESTQKTAQYWNNKLKK